jgi:hypothetical protein
VARLVTLYQTSEKLGLKCPKRLVVVAYTVVCIRHFMSPLFSLTSDGLAFLFFLRNGAGISVSAQVWPFFCSMMHACEQLLASG